MESTSKEKEFENSLFIANNAIIILMSIWYIAKIINIIQFLEVSKKNKGKKIYEVAFLVVKKIDALTFIEDFNLILYMIMLVLIISGIITKTSTNIKYSKDKGNFLIGISLVNFIALHFIDNIIGAIVCLILMVACFIMGAFIHSAYAAVPKVDQFNENNQSFPQTEILIDNEDSVNLMYKYYYNGWRTGFINMLATTRATMVMGTAGSGKTASILEPALWQSIYKGKSGIVYDYKFPNMSILAYNAYFKAIRNNKFAFGKKANGEPIIPKFEVINFTDLRTTSRVNPIDVSYMKNINSAREVAITILVNLNRSWMGKESEFFNASAISLLTMAIYYLKLYTERTGEYVCTIPHMIELLNTNIKDQIEIYGKYPELHSLSGTFQVAIDTKAGDQLAGQVASATNALATLASKEAYWVLSKNDFMLEVNNVDNPIILCLGNDKEARLTYGAIISVFFSSAFKLMKKGNRKGFVMVDELPTIVLNDISYTINTIREIGVSVWLGIQDLAQLVSDYKKEGADTVMNSCGSILWGNVNFETAEKVSKIFGKTNQRKINTGISDKKEISHQISTEEKELLPASRMTTLTPGRFAGKIADTFQNNIEQKLIYGDIFQENMEADMLFKELPKKLDVSDEDLEVRISDNFYKIRKDIDMIIGSELKSYVVK